MSKYTMPQSMQYEPYEGTFVQKSTIIDNDVLIAKF